MFLKCLNAVMDEQLIKYFCYLGIEPFIHKEYLGTHVFHEYLMILVKKVVMVMCKLIIATKKRTKNECLMQKRPKNWLTDNFGSECARGMVLGKNES
jgi:hypothetical protein